MTLPNFVGIGASKSGTTSLFRYLLQHPQIFLPSIKGTNFFSPQAQAMGRATVGTLADYERAFDGAADHNAVGEISTMYLGDPGAAEQIAGTLPNVRVFAILRDPVARTASHYLENQKFGLELRPFDTAAVEGERYVEWSRYHQLLRGYFERFPRERIHVMLYDDFARDPAATLRGLAVFLGVDQDFRFDPSRRHYVASLPRFPRLNRPLWRIVDSVRRVMPARWRGTSLAARTLLVPAQGFSVVSPPAAARLRALFRDDMLATGELIGRDLSHWVE